MGAVLVALLAATVLGRGSNRPPKQDARGDRPALSVLSERPLSTRAAERALTERYLPIPDDDTADVHCGGRIAKPAHSVRRCYVLYPGGSRRGVVVLTTAAGSEVLAEP
jgi:hypothetical protein